MLYYVANIFSFCVCVCLCMILPSALCWFLFCLSSFPVSLSLHLKTSCLLPFFSLPLFSFVSFSHLLTITPLKTSETVLMSDTPFARRCSGEVFVGQSGYFSFSAVLIRGSFWIFVSRRLCMSCVAEATPPPNGVLSNPVCCVDHKSFDRSWCSCLKSDPIPELDPDLNPPQNLSFPETSLSLAPS